MRLFQWIVSDFGLNDAIESGLVKTPRVVVRDDARLGKDFKSRPYHIYADAGVKDDINRKVEPHVPLPDLVNTAYTILGNDWDETRKRWEEEGAPTPPVMITVAMGSSRQGESNREAKWASWRNSLRQTAGDNSTGRVSAWT